MAPTTLLVLAVALVCAFASENQQHGREEADYLEAAFVLPDMEKRSVRMKRSTTIVERPGNSAENHNCGKIKSVPSKLREPMHMYPNGLDVFYQKYTHAYGIPIVGSNNVTDTALKRACYLVRFMLADRPDVRESFYKMFGRLALMAYNEMTTDIPEHSHLDSEYWDARARGLGATRGKPVSTGGEENAMCLKNDRYWSEDIVMHEFAHGVHLIGAMYAIEGFDDRLKALYNSAKEKGLWDRTYAMSNHREYWAEVVQSYFNDERGTIYKRTLLKDYDPDMYNFIEEIWPCKNTFLPRCVSSRDLEQAQVLKMNCNGTENNYFSYDRSCADSNFRCPQWAKDGRCPQKQVFCKRSCRLCTETYKGSADQGSPSSVTPLTSCTDATSDCSSACTSDISRMTQNCRRTCTNCKWYISRHGLM